LHEIIHHTYIKKRCGVVLKLDFEKAYHKVNWDFLICCLEKKGFNEFCCSRVCQILENGTVSVKLNGEMGPYFQSAKGVRHGDPLSPTLFNIAAECLAKMILKAQSNGLFVGLAADLIDKGVAVLQYADDTVLCFEHEPNKAVNIKLVLYVFEIMSGLKINFVKSKVLVVGGDNITGAYYAELFSCQVGHFPTKYLGVPVSYATLRNSDSDFTSGDRAYSPGP
jgi:hypothetical protein